MGIPQIKCTRRVLMHVAAGTARVPQQVLLLQLSIIIEEKGKQRWCATWASMTPHLPL